MNFFKLSSVNSQNLIALVGGAFMGAGSGNVGLGASMMLSEAANSAAPVALALGGVFAVIAGTAGLVTNYYWHGHKIPKLAPLLTGMVLGGALETNAFLVGAREAALRNGPPSNEEIIPAFHQRLSVAQITPAPLNIG